MKVISTPNAPAAIGPYSQGIVSRGFVYVRESVDLMEGARKAAEEAADRCLAMKMTDWGRIKTEVREALGSYVWRTVERNPVIIPIILEVN